MSACVSLNHGACGRSVGKSACAPTDRHPDPSVCRSSAAATKRLTQAHPLWWDRDMYLASTPEANDLLERNPLALLIAMVLDQHSAARTDDVASGPPLIFMPAGAC